MSATALTVVRLYSPRWDVRCYSFLGVTVLQLPSQYSGATAPCEDVKCYSCNTFLLAYLTVLRCYSPRRRGQVRATGLAIREGVARHTAKRPEPGFARRAGRTACPSLATTCSNGRDTSSVMCPSTRQAGVQETSSNNYNSATLQSAQSACLLSCKLLPNNCTQAFSCTLAAAAAVAEARQVHLTACQ